MTSGASAGATSASSSALAAALAPVFAQAEREAGGTLGAAVLHLESGESASYHGRERFPMQSVFKLPLAIDIFARGYLDDARDTATPEAMAGLLARVHWQDLLKKSSAARLVAILERVGTGKDRLKGLLPAGTPVAHKTGTSDETDGVTATVNDVGIITLPGGAGHVVVVAFLSGSRGDAAARAHAIALLGRAVFDHFAPR